jgi:hypothetical protein
MADSILQTEKECWFCGAQTDLERHHIFAGVANRPISEKYGLTVWLCHKHHTGTRGAQYDKEMGLQLKRAAQRAFEEKHGHRLWMELIRKNYL